MAPRPNWKGYLKLSLVSCPIALYPATSAAERVSFNQINKNTGNRIRYKKVDAETEEPVEQADIIKGYPVEKNVYVTHPPRYAAFNQTSSPRFRLSSTTIDA